MFHSSAVGIEINEFGKPNTPFSTITANHIKGYLKNKSNELLKKMELTDKELKDFNKGKDVWFDVERTKQILLSKESLSYLN